MSNKRKRAKQIVSRMEYEKADANRKTNREAKKQVTNEEILSSLKKSKQYAKISVDLIRQILDPNLEFHRDRTEGVELSSILPDNHPYAHLFTLYANMPGKWDGDVKKEGEKQKAFRDLCIRVAEINKRVLIYPISTDLTFAHILANIAWQHEYWIRDLEDWDPKTHNVHKLLSSLLRHLLAKYSIPFCIDTLYNIRPFTEHCPQILPKEEIVVYDMFMLFPQVGQGGNLRKILANKIPLTKKMSHILMSTTGHQDFFPSLRRAQILGMGGDQHLIRAVNATSIGRGVSIFEEETFYLTLFKWFINNPMTDLAQLGPLLDYINHMRRLNGEYKMAGRSPNRVYEDMINWHRELQQDGRFEDLPPVFKPSGLKTGEFETLEKGKKILWTITEILNPKDLRAEGRRMKHCVFSYANSIATGQVSIWRMSCYRELTNETERCVTIEVNRTKSILQVRGRCNRMPTRNEKLILSKWATQNSLTLKNSLSN